MIFSFCTFLLVYANFEVTGSSSMNGDIIFGGLLDIWNSVDGQCSDVIRPLSVKYNEAIKWTLKRLNEQDFIPGVKLGLQTWPTCGLVTQANDRTIDIINRIRADKNETTRNSPPLVGLIGPEHSSQAGNTSLLLSALRADDRLIQIGFSTTATSLENVNAYRNFYRVVPSDQVQIEAMLALLKELEWNYIVVIYDEDVYGIESFQSFKSRAQHENICIIKDFGIHIAENDAVSSSQIRGFLDRTLDLSVSGVIVFSTEKHSKVLLQAAHALGKVKSDPFSFVFSEGIALSDDVMKDVDSGKGSFVTAPRRIVVEEFEMYYKEIFENVSRLIEESETNEWLRNVFSFYKTDNCFPSNDPVNPQCKNLEHSETTDLSKNYLYTDYAIEATYVLAKLIKEIHSVKCGGQNGVCTELQTLLYQNKGQITKEIDGLLIKFDSDVPFLSTYFGNVSLSYVERNGLPNATGYDVFHYRKCLNDENTFCYVQIGEYTISSLKVDKARIRDYHNNPDGNKWPNVNHAQCPKGQSCESCVVHDITNDVFFRDGDVIVCGIIPIHNKNNSDALKCDQIRTSLGVEIAESLAFAVAHENETYFPGKKIGFAFINSCNQPLVLQRKLLELLNKGVLKKDGTYIPISNKLLGCIGAYGSGISAVSASILSQVKIVQIAYASTAALLSDRISYPYFMRTCTPDDKQAKAMMKIIRELKSNFIQVVYSEGTYGEGGRDAIRKEAKLSTVCIKREIMVKEGENYRGIIEELRKNSFAKIVIIFLRSHIVDIVMDTINSDMNYGEFMFIGSEAWGYKPDTFQNKKKLIGSISLALQMAESQDFTSYLRNLNVFEDTQDPWIKAYAEKKFDCYFSSSFDKRGSTECDRDLKFATSSSFKQELWTPFAQNAMHVLLAGASEAFIERCGEGSSTLCENYRRSPETVRNKIIKQKLDINGDGTPVPVFDENGDGNIGYRIYNLQKSSSDANIVVYKQIGHSPLREEDFQFESDMFVSPEEFSLPSVCPNDKTCSECFPKDSNTSPNVAVQTKESNSTTTSVLGAFVGIFGLLIAVLAGYILYSKRKQTLDPYADTYIDPVNDPYLTPFGRGQCNEGATIGVQNSSQDSGFNDTVT